ncbi:hypothetical protein J3R80_01060 [Aliiroseovarius sp. Z3]|uniref:hypothetical protein n=1 Tax=Aliiroseovarius sp. Z3 TaxID=2811402 RepID=UPI0023B33815|nr:hypothetical protein [Aliiroseovarius sp. Z3]MDE9449057.1 hypothetical protein [Aliiroseovarius sp. Z3]
MVGTSSQVAQWALAELATVVPGAHVKGQAHVGRTDFASARFPKSLVLAATQRFLREALENSNVSAVVTTPDLAGHLTGSCGAVVADDPTRTFYLLHNHMAASGMRPDLVPGISSKADIHPKAIIEENVSIADGACVEAGAIVRSGSVLSEGVLVGAGAIIGADGHFYKRFDGKLLRVLHAGGVFLDKGAQVLSGAIVQKALHPAFTSVGEDSIISVAAHLGHGVEVGSRTTITGSVQIAGYSKIGDDVWIGPSAVVRNLISVGNGARIEIGAVVARSVPEGGCVSSPFAMDHKRTLRKFAEWTS